MPPLGPLFAITRPRFSTVPADAKLMPMPPVAVSLTSPLLTRVQLVPAGPATATPHSWRYFRRCQCS